MQKRRNRWHPADTVEIAEAGADALLAALAEERRQLYAALWRVLTWGREPHGGAR